MFTPGRVHVGLRLASLVKLIHWEWKGNFHAKKFYESSNHKNHWCISTKVTKSSNSAINYLGIPRLA